MGRGSKVVLSKDELELARNLYINEGYSTRMIANVLGIGKSTVAKKAKEWGIELRDSSQSMNNAVANGRHYSGGKLLGIFKDIDFDNGIYILKSNSEIVYVGKSLFKIKHRLYSHISDDNKKFDEIVVYNINNIADIHLVEVMLIIYIKPIYNKDCYTESEVSIDLEGNINAILSKANTIEVKLDNGKSCPNFNPLEIYEQYKEE